MNDRIEPILRLENGRETSASPILRLENLSKTYPAKSGFHTVLTPTSLTLAVSELVSIVGPSGCGKSTLLHIVAGLITPTSGRVFLDGAEVCEPGAERGVVFQAYTLFPWLTVRRNVEFGPKLRGVKRAEREKISNRFLEAVGLEDYRGLLPEGTFPAGCGSASPLRGRWRMSRAFC